MNSSIYISLAVEDDLSEIVLRKILAQSQRNYCVTRCLKRGGRGYLKKKIQYFNKAAQGHSFLLLTDLDQIKCPPILIQQWLPTRRHPNLLFRVVVREVEAWILADRQSFARFLGISLEHLPHQVETLPDPKQYLINLTKKCRKKELREGIVPKLKSTAKQGPAYNALLSDFVQNTWNVQTAQAHSPSLQRTLKALKEFKPQQPTGYNL